MRDLLVLGLGNPGPKYEHSRHNVGFDTVERLCTSLNLFFKLKRMPAHYQIATDRNPQSRLILVKPLTFMNDSGRILPALMRRYDLSSRNLLVVVDNMDLEPGVCRLKLKGSAAGHNGLKSIQKYWGSGDFMRLYIGVGRPGPKGDVVKHVLSRPPKVEDESYDAAFGKAVEAIVKLRELDPEAVMNELNRKNAD